MDTLTLTPTPTAAAATISSASAHAANRNLGTDPKQMAVMKVWNSMMRGTRKCCEEQDFVAIHNMPHIIGVTGACENTDTLFMLDWCDGKRMLLPQPNQLYFITHYPADIKSFNMRNDDPSVVNSSDLPPLASESAGSAEREFDGAKLRHKLKTNSMLKGLIRQVMKLEDFKWYLSFHEEHDVQLHSGVSVGMARVAQFILGQADIREYVPFLINRDTII